MLRHEALLSTDGRHEFESAPLETNAKLSPSPIPTKRAQPILGRSGRAILKGGSGHEHDAALGSDGGYCRGGVGLDRTDSRDRISGIDLATCTSVDSVRGSG